jgi:hypothetical protein
MRPHAYQGSAAAGTPERREKKGIHRAQTLHNMRDSKETVHYPREKCVVRLFRCWPLTFIIVMFIFILLLLLLLFNEGTACE